MCVIINKPKDIKISNTVLRKCWEANPHGGGFMYVDNGKLVVTNGLMTFDEFYGAFQKVDPKKHIVLHFRLASYGSIVPEQTHPMFIHSKLAFVHNGHMLNKFIKESTNSNTSDTMIFKDKILKELPENFLDVPVLVELINGYIEYSVMLFLDSKDKVTILGDDEDSCIYKGSWFSNDLWNKDTVSEEIEGHFANWDEQGVAQPFESQHWLEPLE
jgi:predicted glutamine amidotransferase